MGNWADYSTGQRIKILRGTELTQQQLAEAADVSLSLVQKAEQDKGSLSIGSLLKLAAALMTDVSVILGQQAPRRGMSRDTRAALRRLSDAVHDSALGDWDGIGDPSTLAELAHAHERVSAAYWSGDTMELSHLVSKVLIEGRARYEDASGYQRQQLGSMLASTYQFASSCALLLGQRDLALGALTAARMVAADAGDAVLSALLDSTLSWIHLRGAKVSRAVTLAERAAAGIEPSFSKPARPELLAYGRLMISAAVAASRKGDACSADDYLSQAHAAAARLGRDESLYGTHFGPTAASTEAVGIAVALGNYGRALKLAARTDLPRSMPKLARNRYKLDVALAQCEAKFYDQAASNLIEVGLDSPEWIKHQALPGVIGKRLARVSTSKVRRISEIIGVPLIAWYAAYGFSLPTSPGRIPHLFAERYNADTIDAWSVPRRITTFGNLVPRRTRSEQQRRCDLADAASGVERFTRLIYLCTAANADPSVARAACEEYAATFGWDVVAVIDDDTGLLPPQGRDGLTRAIERIREGQAGAVLTAWRSMISPIAAEFDEVAAEIEKAGGFLHVKDGWSGARRGCS